jgi:hypothetical protein
MNNTYKNLPALMSDGRLFTDYRQNVDINDSIKSCLSIEDENKYRKTIHTNGFTKVLNACKNNNKNIAFFPNWGEHNKLLDGKFPNKNDPKYSSINTPGFKYLETCDSNNCKKTELESNGIGTKYDLK